LLMCKSTLFVTAITSLPPLGVSTSAGARVYFTSVSPSCQIRLSLLRFIISALGGSLIHSAARPSPRLTSLL
jgi:hypothetical protein